MKKIAELLVVASSGSRQVLMERLENHFSLAGLKISAFLEALAYAWMMARSERRIFEEDKGR